MNRILSSLLIRDGRGLASRTTPLVACLFLPLLVGLALTQNAALIRAQEAKSTPDKQKVASTPDYKPGDVNLEFSRVYIFVDKTTNLGHTHGVEGKIKDGFVLEDREGDGKLVFDMRSFVADTKNARKVFNIDAEIDSATIKKVNQNMLGAEILDVQKHPEASLTNATLKKTGKTSNRGTPEYSLDGEFTLHGVTKKVSIPCDGESKDGWLHVRGRFTIRQTDFGIKPYSKMFGAVGIKDELIIQGDLWLVPKS